LASLGAVGWGAVRVGAVPVRQLRRSPATLLPSDHLCGRCAIWANGAAGSLTVEW